MIEIIRISKDIYYKRRVILMAKQNKQPLYFTTIIMAVFIIAAVVYLVMGNEQDEPVERVGTMDKAAEAVTDDASRTQIVKQEKVAESYLHQEQMVTEKISALLQLEEQKIAVTFKQMADNKLNGVIALDIAEELKDDKIEQIITDTMQTLADEGFTITKDDIHITNNKNDILH